MKVNSVKTPVQKSVVYACTRSIELSYAVNYSFDMIKTIYMYITVTPRETTGFSNHRRLKCLFNNLLNQSTIKTPKLLCEGIPHWSVDSPQRASNAENMPISWRPHDTFHRKFEADCIHWPEVMWFLRLIWPSALILIPFGLCTGSISFLL